MHETAWTLTRYLVRQGAVESEDAEVYAYGFEVLIANAAQILLLLLAGILLGCVMPMAAFTAFFVGIKRHIGGYHCNTHAGCITVATVLSIAGVLLAGLLPVWATLPCLGLAAALVVRYAPIPHPNHPQTPEQLRRARKTGIRVLAVESLLAGLLLMSPLSRLAVAGAMGLLLAALTLTVSSKKQEGTAI